MTLLWGKYWLRPMPATTIHCPIKHHKSRNSSPKSPGNVSPIILILLFCQSLHDTCIEFGRMGSRKGDLVNQIFRKYFHKRLVPTRIKLGNINAMGIIVAFCVFLVGNSELEVECYYWSVLATSNTGHMTYCHSGLFGCNHIHRLRPLS